MNISEPIEKTNSKGITNQRREIVMVYAGGLHYNRHKTLGLLAKSIQRYNSKGNKKVFLKIFSGSKVTRNIKKELNIEGASHLFGFLDEKNLKKELNNCDIPVHVESFDQSSIESTRLSISTKIPEYLSLGKPILAIGPSNVSSLKYLKDSAYCIVRPENVYSDLKNLLEDHSLKKALGEKAYSMYRRNHLPSIVSKRLVRAIVKTMSQ